MMTDDELLEQAISKQVEKQDATVQDTTEKKQITKKPDNEASQYIGKKLHRNPATGRTKEEETADHELAKEKGLSRVGDNIVSMSESREGWLDVDRALLGARDIFYPEDWQFRIRPANVEAVRNWSVIDETDPNSVDDVFNEMLKACLSIRTAHGPIPWGNINSWDRLFFILLIREYTFVKGEKKVEMTVPCPDCDNDVTMELTAQNLGFDMPDESVMKYYDPATQTWNINPAEFGLDADPITLYLPTLDKGANIKSWMFDTVRANQNAKLDPVFLRFLPWLCKRVPKDTEAARRQIRQYTLKFKSWDEDMFMFMDDILNNITVTPKTTLTANCPVCGTEVTAEMRFPNGIKSLFEMERRFKKFGTK